MVREIRTHQRLGNDFLLFDDGREFLARMLAAVNASERYVLMEFYLVHSGSVATRFVDALCAAAARGVAVRMILDAIGARGFQGTDRHRLRNAGVRLAVYNSPRLAALGHLFHRDHRKLLLVDGSVGFTGGAGLADEFSPDEQPAQYWQDCMLQMRGPVLLDWHRLFARTWERCAWIALDVAPRHSAPSDAGSPGRVRTGSALGSTALGQSAIAHINRAQQRVWIATPYFWPSRRLRRALRAAALRGVDVRLILPGPFTDAPLLQHISRRFYRRLLASGVLIFEFQARFLHCKLILCDDWASIGSSNLDRWGSLWNLEANQEIESAQFTRQVIEVCNRLYSQCSVLRRPEEVPSRWSAWIWRFLARAAFAWSIRHVARLRRQAALKKPARAIAIIAPRD